MKIKTEKIERQIVEIEIKVNVEVVSAGKYAKCLIDKCDNYANYQLGGMLSKEATIYPSHFVWEVCENHLDKLGELKNGN